MRRTGIAVVVGVAAVALVAPLPASASHQDGRTGGRDFAVGAGRNMLAEVSPFPVALRLSAHAFDAELPTLEGLFAGSDVTGHAVGSGVFPVAGAFRVEGEVTCLKVVGNRATIKYRFKNRQGPGAPPPGGVQVFIEDNGSPSGATPDGNATDAPQPQEVFEPAADQCELPRGPFNPVDGGNYVVHDADSLPAP